MGQCRDPPSLLQHDPRTQVPRLLLRSRGLIVAYPHAQSGRPTIFEAPLLSRSTLQDGLRRGHTSTLEGPLLRRSTLRDGLRRGHTSMVDPSCSHPTVLRRLRHTRLLDLRQHPLLSGLL